MSGVGGTDSTNKKTIKQKVTESKFAQGAVKLGGVVKQKTIKAKGAIQKKLEQAGNTINNTKAMKTIKEAKNSNSFSTENVIKNAPENEQQTPYNKDDFKKQVNQLITENQLAPREAKGLVKLAISKGQTIDEQLNEGKIKPEIQKEIKQARREGRKTRAKAVGKLVLGAGKATAKIIGKASAKAVKTTGKAAKTATLESFNLLGDLGSAAMSPKATVQGIHKKASDNVYKPARATVQGIHKKASENVYKPAGEKIKKSKESIENKIQERKENIAERKFQQGLKAVGRLPEDKAQEIINNTVQNENIENNQDLQPDTPRSGESSVSNQDLGQLLFPVAKNLANAGRVKGQNDAKIENIEEVTQQINTENQADDALNRTNNT